MTTLTWQTLLLLAITYFAGCCIGCLARRAAWRRRAQPALQEAAQSHAAPVAGPVPTLAFSDRSTAAAATVANRSAAVVIAQEGREPFRRADTSKPLSGPATGTPGVTLNGASAAARFERILEAGGDGSGRPQPDAAVPGGASDDLKRIRAIDAALEARLKALGAGTFAAMAQWTAADTARLSRELGFKGRIEQENWIEQAQILARGGDTRYSQRLARGEAAAARPIEDEGEPRAPAMLLAPAVAGRPVAEAGESASSGDAVSSPDVSDRAAFAQKRPGTAEVERPVVPPARPAARSEGDDLQRIRGINTEIGALLNGQGVTRYEQIASWSRVDTGRFDGLLGQDGRIGRENWIEQAQILAKGGDTAYSRDYERGASGEAQAEQHADEEQVSGARGGRASDLAALRSVRSEAYRTGPAAVRGHPAELDDLKRIRGIGILIERKLNSLGIATYEHIANWTAGDIDRVSQVLDFKGRIERENWVEQARILASGGQTEFSRRMDRGSATRSSRA